MRPKIRYEFRSHKGDKVLVVSRMGEEAARSAAMKHLWGPPSGWCLNRGTGLFLVSETEEEDVKP
jgi:hypothetical protein